MRSVCAQTASVVRFCSSSVVLQGLCWVADMATLDESNGLCDLCGKEADARFEVTHSS